MTALPRTPGLHEVRYQVGGRTRHAGLFVPARRDDDSLVVYLHGKGERGDAMEHVAYGLGKAIAARPERFTGFVLLPQCPRDRLWVAVDQPWSEGLPGAEDHFDAALDFAERELRVPSSRTALTGLSMGGFATLMFGADRVARFAAFAALCGGGRTRDAAVLADRPVWLVHGSQDPAVLPQESRRMATAIRSARPDAALRLTEYADLAHNCWDRAYGDPELVAFLFRPGFG